MLTLFVRSLILFVSAVIAMRLMGKREVGQLQPYELVVVIMIAELAATPIGDAGSPLLYGILPMTALVICHGIISWLCMKSAKFRALMCGRPTVLIREGVIDEKRLQEMSITIADLMEELRLDGMMDPSEVGGAVLETSGKVTAFPKAENRPVTPGDMGMNPAREGLPLTLIVDGKVQKDNLRLGKLSDEWLLAQLKALGFSGAEKVLLMYVNTQGMVMAQGKGMQEVKSRKGLSPEEVSW